MEYFEYYGLAPSFFPDEDLLRKRYLSKQKEWHPDFFAGNPEDLEKAIANTSFNNSAFKTLKDFYPRLEYILQQKGLMSDSNRNVLSAEFLSEMLDVNDLIEEAQSGSQEARHQATQILKNMWAENDKALRSLLHSAGAPENVSAEQWQQILSYDHIRRYLRRLELNLSGVNEM